MSFNFVIPQFNINGAGTSPLQFFRKGFILNGSGGSGPSWKDIILHGVTALTLVNSKQNGLNYLKLFGGTELKSILPKGYTQVEYLESSGTQYIDTGVVLKSEATITMVGQSLETTSTVSSFWGFMDGSSNIPRWGWAIYQDKWLPSLNNTQATNTADTKKHTFISTCYYNDNNVLEYDSLLDDNSILAQVVNNVALYTSNIISTYLFARNNKGTAGNFLNCRIFSFNIVQDDVLVINLIPARRNSDSVLGMYDTVTGNFLTNAGKGDFVAGGNAVPTPDIPMNIVCNNGVIKYGIYSQNIFNKNDTENIGTWYSSSNQTITLANANETLVMRAKPNTTYYFKHCSVKGGCRAFYTEVENWTTGSPCSEMSGNVVANANTVYSITTSANAKWIFFNYGRNNVEASFDDQRNDFMVSTSELTSETPYEPYKFGLHVDGTTETVRVHGKNLLDNNTKHIISGTQWRYMDSVATGGGFVLKKDVTYTLSATTPVFVYFYDYNTYTSIKSGQQTCTYTPTEDVRVFFLVYLNPALPDDTLVQLELGSTATDYEPYFNGGSATAEMLLKVGDYQDEQSVLDGKVTRNIGIKVMTGDETFLLGTNGWISEDAITNNLKDTYAPICTHFAGTDTTPTANSNTVRVYYTSQNIPRVYFGVNKSIYTSAEVFQQFLADQYNAGTPVIIIYPLKTATTETVTGQPLTIQAGTNVVEITQASINNLELEVSYKAGVEVTVTEIENAQLDNSVEVTVNG